MLICISVQAQSLECCEERLQAPSGVYIASGVICQSWKQQSPYVIRSQAITLQILQSQSESTPINSLNFSTKTVHLPIVAAQEISIPEMNGIPMIWIFLVVGLFIICIWILLNAEERKREKLQQKHKQTLSDLHKKVSALQSELSLKETAVVNLQAALSTKEEEITIQAEAVDRLQDKVAQLEQQVEQVRKENLLKLLLSDQDQLNAMYNAFVETRSKFEDLLTVVFERLELSEEVLEGLDHLLKAQRGMMVEIQGNGQGPLKLVVPIPDDPYEFLGINSDVTHDVKKMKKRRDQLLQQFHPDKVNVLNLEWVTKLYTKMTEEINIMFDRARNN